MFFKKTTKLFVIAILSSLAGAIACNRTAEEKNEEEATADTKGYLTSVMDFKMEEYDADSEEGKMIALGESLVKETYKYFFKEDGSKIGNRLACTSCHLNGGTTPFAAPFVGINAVFPQYRPREGKVGSLEERINGCFERSMAGEAIPVDGEEMRAMVAYMKHLSKDVKMGEKIEGTGFVKLEIPDRAVDLEKGALVYEQQCVSCHMKDGQGLMLPDKDGYIYPPLWGDDSYNDGAGMNRVLTAAKFIKANMPLGVTYDAPQLTDEEAFDVAGYINSHGRSVKANKEKDFPTLSEKPKDASYPPYADDISQEQHKYGPFNF